MADIFSTITILLFDLALGSVELFYVFGVNLFQTLKVLQELSKEEEQENDSQEDNFELIKDRNVQRRVFKLLLFWLGYIFIQTVYLWFNIIPGIYHIKVITLALLTNSYLDILGKQYDRLIQDQSRLDEIMSFLTVQARTLILKIKEKAD